MNLDLTGEEWRMRRPHSHKLVKVIVPKALKAQLLSRLFKMNISAQSLFPGIDGYCRSLGERLAYQWPALR